MSHDAQPEQSLSPVPTRSLTPNIDSRGPQPDETTRLLPTPHNKVREEDEPVQKDSHFRDVESEAQAWWLFASVLFAYTLATFDATIMASSHPVITSYFGASHAASWMSTVFYLTSTVSQPLYGRISDVVGRRVVYISSITLFFVTTGWCGLAQTVGSFIAARAACGLAAGGVVALSTIIMSDIVRIEYRGVYQSYLNLAFGAGNGLGAALGGILCDRLGWRMVFGIQLVPIAGFWLLAIFATPVNLGPCLAKSEGKTIREAFRSFDSLGAVVLTITISGLIMGINLGGNIFPWTHPVVLAALVCFALAAASLVFVENRAQHPILPMRLLSTRPNGNIIWSNLCGSMMTGTILFNVPLFMQAVKQVSATRSGMVLLAPLIGISATSVFTGFFITWTRRMKPMLTIGAILMLMGSIAITCLFPELPEWAIITMIPWANIGGGFFFSAATVAVLAINPHKEQAVVTTTLGLARNLGAIMGVAISSLVCQNTLVLFLNKEVTGDEAVKQHIISEVRTAIKSIAGLDPVHKAEVTLAYSNAMRATFATCILFTIVINILVHPMRIPKLRSSSRVESKEVEDGEVH